MNVGLTVQQGEATSVGTLTPAPTRRVAALVQRERGIPFKAVRIYGPQEDIKRYGKRLSGAYSYQAIQHLFAEVGGIGADITQVRVLDEANSTTARGELFEGTLSGQLVTRTVTVNGVLGTTSRVVRYAWSNFVAGDTIRVTIGSTNFDYVVQPGDVLSDLIAGIGAEIVTAQGNNNVDALSVTWSNGGTYIQLTGTVTTRTSNVVNSHNPARMSFSSTWATLSSGDRVKVTGSPDITDQNGTVVANPFVNVIDSDTVEYYLDSGLTQPLKVAISSPVATYTMTWGGVFSDSSTIIPGAATRVATIWAGQQGEKDPGTWANTTQTGGVYVRLIPPGNPLGRANEYLFEVYYENKRVEQFSDASLVSLFSKINNQSFYVMVETDTIVAVTAVTVVQLSQGTYTAPTESMYYPITDDLNPRGLAVLDRENVQLVICPDVRTTTMATALKSYCASKETLEAYHHLERGLSDSSIKTISSALTGSDLSNRYLGVYNLWVKVGDENGNDEWIPGYGATVGAFIKTQALNANRVWTPPAGTTGIFTQVRDIEPKYLPTQRGRINTMVQEYLVNVAVYEEGVGFYLISSRTCCTRELYHSLSVSFHTNYNMATLISNYSKTFQKNNTPEAAENVIIELRQFFRAQYDDGGLERTVPFETAFQVISDTSNNPRTQSRKIRNFDINWIPVECLESVVFNLNRNDGVLLITQQA